MNYQLINLSKLELLSECVGDYYGVTKEQIVSRSRLRDFVIPRQIFCFLARKYTTSTLKEIGSFIFRDHASVIYACESIEGQMSVDKTLRKRVEEISSEYEVKNSDKYETLSERRDKIREEMKLIRDVIISNRYVDSGQNVLDVLKSIDKINELI